MGLAVIGGVQYNRIRKRSEEESEEVEKGRVRIEGPWQVKVASALPLRAMSRLWGEFNELNLPTVLRNPLFKLYSYIFGCNLAEMEIEDLQEYKNLNSFFFRKLKPDARPVDSVSELVCPSDGRVMSAGIVVDREIGQVKGATYSLDALLQGKVTQNHAERVAPENDFAKINSVSYSLDGMLSEPQHTLHPTRKGNSLFYCVIYLAPGDYHRFHSPADWTITTRRHVSGELFSVSPYMVRILSKLFTLNERVVLLGKWRHGFFSMIPVGATNVGSIKINIDPELRTNLAHRDLEPAGEVTEVSYSRGNENFVREASKLSNWKTEIQPSLTKDGYKARKGQELGGFRLGSTVVLVFEAPSEFDFSVKAGDRVRFGQPL